jgi:ABC-type transport system substrate-binding protein
MWWVLAPEGWSAPAKDKRVREAMNIAIDRQEISQAIFAGRAEPAAVPMGLSWSFKDIGFKVAPEMTYTYDPARAKKLLADAGHPGGFALDVYAYQLPGLPEGKAMAEAVAGYWEKIGIKMAYSPSKPNDTANDPEIDGMIAQVMRQTDREKINALMRNVYARLRSEHYGMPLVYLHSPYATSKTLGKWNPGSVMYDLFLDQLASSK